MICLHEMPFGAELEMLLRGRRGVQFGLSLVSVIDGRTRPVIDGVAGHSVPRVMCDPGEAVH